jgi:hypothetical protein
MVKPSVESAAGIGCDQQKFHQLHQWPGSHKCAADLNGKVNLGKARKAQAANKGERSPPSPANTRQNTRYSRAQKFKLFP